MIETMTLSPGVTLRLCRDSRFKQGCLSFLLLRRMDRKEDALGALLPAVLLRGTRRHRDLRAITDHLDTLYGASVAPMVRRNGDYQSNGLYCAFMDDRFALPGDQVLLPMLEFVREILLEPLTVGDAFHSAIVESEKKNLIATIESELNDKRSYAMSQMLRVMCSTDTFGLPRLGEKEQVEAITPESLYDHYRRILKTSPIHIFYVGSADAQTVAEGLRPLLDALEAMGREPLDMAPQTVWNPSPEKNVTEVLDVAQGKLCMGFTTPITNRDPEFPAMQVMNTLFGSGMTSKLFMNVREKLSLCYSVGSGYYGTKGIVAVSAGIDFDKESVTREEVMRQLAACQAGDITPLELSAAKEAILSSLRATHDSPGAIEGYYATAAVSGLKLSPQDYMAAVEQVTVEDVTAAARTVKLHTIYFLKGESQ